MFDLKEVKVSNLKEWEINPRIHSDKGLSDVKDSIEKFGMVRFLFCDKDLTIVGGHARKKVLVKLGVESVKCFVAKKKLSKKDFKTIALLSNQIYSSFNLEKVNDTFSPSELLDMGFDNSEVDFSGEGIEPDENKGGSGGGVESYPIKLKFRTELERERFELFLSGLNNRFSDIDTEGERFIQFLKEEL